MSSVFFLSLASLKLNDKAVSRLKSTYAHFLKGWKKRKCGCLCLQIPFWNQNKIEVSSFENGQSQHYCLRDSYGPNTKLSYSLVNSVAFPMANPNDVSSPLRKFNYQKKKKIKERSIITSACLLAILLSHSSSSRPSLPCCVNLTEVTIFPDLRSWLNSVYHHHKNVLDWCGTSSSLTKKRWGVCVYMYVLACIFKCVHHINILYTFATYKLYWNWHINMGKLH